MNRPTVVACALCIVVAPAAYAQSMPSPAESPPEDAPEVADDEELAAPATEAVEPAVAPPPKRQPASSPPARRRPTSSDVEEAKHAPPAEPPPTADANVELFDKAALEALNREASSLRQAQSQERLTQLCDGKRVAQAILDRKVAAVWQALCRGWAFQAGHDMTRAQHSFESAIAQVAALPSSQRHATRDWAAEAHYCIGQMYESRYRAYEPCLTRLGDIERAPSEAKRRAELRASAERAYREVFGARSQQWSLRALFQISAMSDHYYRLIGGAPVGLRGFQAGSPLEITLLEDLPLHQTVLAPKRSGLRRAILLSYRRLLKRVRRSSVSAELGEHISRAVAELEAYKPFIEKAPTTAWPPRAGEDHGIAVIERGEGGYTVTFHDGTTQRWQGDLLVERMRELLKPSEHERWAPLAAVALGEAEAVDTLPALLTALGAEHDPELQVAAAYALGILGSPDAIEPLVQTFAGRQRDNPRPLFGTYADTVRGLRERIIGALIAIGRRNPREIDKLRARHEIPLGEVAFILWRVKDRNLYNAYVKLREDRDPQAASYGMLGTVDLHGENARWLLRDSAADPPLLRCTKAHLLDTLE